MSEKLKPCPFCGGDKVSLVETEDFENANKGLSSWHVSCKYNNCHGSIFSLYVWQFRSRTQAVKAWNTRATPTFTKKDVEKLAKIILDNANHCDEMDGIYCFSDGINFPFSDIIKKALNAVGRVEE